MIKNKEIKMKIIMIITLMSLISPTHASRETSFNPWTVDAAFGMALYPDTASHDSQTAIGRLSLGHALFTQPYWQAGIEAGIQSGTSMRLALPKESIDVLGGVPIEAEIKPMLDLLIGVKTKPLVSVPIVAWLKVGAAYRTLRVDRPEVNNLNNYSPELDVGLGYQVNEQTAVTIGYQSIWGKKPQLTVFPETQTGVLRYIPAQQALLLGFSFNFL
jgi:hypothetical protein